MESHEGPGPLREALAVDEAAVVGAERLLEGAQEARQHLLVDGVARGLRLHEELHRPGREGNVAGRARPVRHQAVRVDGRGNEGQGVLHRAVHVLLAALLAEQGPELAEGDVGAGPAHLLLGAAVGVVAEEVEARGHAHERGLSRQQDLAPQGARPSRLRHRGQCEGHARLQLLELALREALAIVPQGQPRLEGVARSVGAALHAHAEQHLGPLGLAFGSARRRLHGDGYLDALGLVRGEDELEACRTLKLDALRAHFGRPRSSFAFDHPAHRGRGEAVARPHEARQGGLDDHGQPHRHLGGGVAEPFGPARDLRPQLEGREVVGELHGDGGGAGRTHHDGRVVVRHRLEVLAHGGAIEQPRFLHPAVAPGVLGEGQGSQGQVARVVDAQVRLGPGQEVGHRVEALLAAQGQDGRVHQPKRDLAGQGSALGILEVDGDVDLLPRTRGLRVLQAGRHLVRHRVHVDPGRGREGGGLAEIRVVAGQAGRCRASGPASAGSARGCAG